MNDTPHRRPTTIWLCEECENRVDDAPESECASCGAEAWDERKACPECAAPMDYNGASNRLGTQSVSWYECPDCGTLVDDLGNVTTPADQERQKREAREAARSCTNTDQEES